MTRRSISSHEIRGALGSAGDLYDQRNHAVHAIWFGIADDPERRAAHRARRWRRATQRRDWTVPELRKLALDMHTVSMIIWQLVDRYES
jgi:hypothetical protein